MPDDNNEAGSNEELSDEGGCAETREAFNKNRQSDTLSTTRRSFIKKTSAAGFLPVASLTTTNESTIRLPELRNQDGVVKWMTVPKSWNQHRLKAEQQVEKFQEENRGKPGVVQTGLVASTQTFGGKRGFEIEVAVDPERQNSEVTDSYNNIPVRTIEKREPSADLCWNHDIDDNEIPGGAALIDEYIDFVASSGYHIEYNNEAAILTAQHFVSQGDDVYGDDENNGAPASVKIGYCAGTNYSADAAAIKSNSRSPVDVILGEYTTWDQGGWVTEAGISDRVVSPIDGYSKMGSTTGRTTGGLGEYHLDDSYSGGTRSYHGHGVRGSANVADGDSGGPAFSLHNGDAYIISPVTQGDTIAGKKSSNSNCRNENPYKKSIGTAAYYLNQIGFQTTGTSHS